MKKKIVAIIQARMGSSRLPGKVLKKLMGKPVLWHIHKRLGRVDAIDEVCVATSYLKRDDEIEDFCNKNDIRCFRGNDADVLDRFYKAALECLATHVIRISGDSPLIDAPLVKEMMDYFYQNKLQYCGIATGPTVKKNRYYGHYPDGLEAEIFTFKALEKAWKEADGLLYREHVTPYLWKHPNKFKTGVYMAYGKDYGEHRWTMDSEEEYEVIQNVYENLYPKKPGFNMNDVFDLMDRQPHIFRKQNSEYLNQM